MCYTCLSLTVGVTVSNWLYVSAATSSVIPSRTDHVCQIVHNQTEIKHYKKICFQNLDFLHFSLRNILGIYRYISRYEQTCALKMGGTSFNASVRNLSILYGHAAIKRSNSSIRFSYNGNIELIILLDNIVYKTKKSRGI